MRARPLMPREALREMNITPLVDVMLVLLVIFMIAAPVLAHQVPITIPQGLVDPPRPHETVRVTVRADGALRWNEQALPAVGFEPQLALQMKAAPETDLVLVVDPEAPYALVADLASIARRQGVANLAFADR